MKKALLFILFAILPLSLFAVDFSGGGSLVNSFALEDTSLTEEAFTVDEKLTLSGWFDLSHKNNGFSLSLVGQGHIDVHGELTDGEVPANHIPFLFDVDSLRFKMAVQGPVTFKLNAGRMLFADPTGQVMLHTADGLKLSLQGAGARLTLSGGYTGLIQNPESDIRISDADWEDEGDPTNILFGPSRVYTELDITFLGKKKLKEYSIFAVGQFDLRTDSRPKVHSQFLGFRHLKLHGQYWYENNYFLMQAMETIDSTGDISYSIGAMFAMNYDFYRSDWLNSHINIRILGGLPQFLDIGEIPDTGITIPFSLSGFVPVSVPSLGVLVSPDITNLGLIGLGYSLRPFSGGGRKGLASRIQIGVNARGYFMLSTLGISWIDLKTIESDFSGFSPYIGTEVDLGLSWRIVSDIGVGLIGAVFIPANGPGGAAAEGTQVLGSVRLNVSVSF